MATIINADTNNGLKLNSDTSGELELQANDTTIVSIKVNGVNVENGNLGIGTDTPSDKLTVQDGTGLISSNSNWNFANLNLERTQSNNGSPRFIGMPLDGDSLSSTVVGEYNGIWGEYDSAPTQGSTSAELNGKMVYGAYAGHIWKINGTGAMTIDSNGISTPQDMKVNDVTVGSKDQTNTTVVGRNALGNMTTGTHNTALGYASLRDLTEGTHNTALGMQTLANNNTGKNNVAVGHNALTFVTNDSNTAIGYNAGKDITTGSNNTCLGYNAQPSSPTVSNEVTIGGTNVTKTRLRGDVDISGSLSVNGSPVGGGGGGVPIGAIMMWSGATNTIPSGWRLCDGGGGTPDLRNRFPVGAGSTYALKATGGSANAVIVEHNHSGSVTINNKTGLDGTLTLINRGGSSGANSLMRARSGSVTTATSGQGSYGEGWRGESGSNSSKATFKLNHNHTGSISISNKGSTGVDKNLPPYIGLYYIMKMED